METTGKTLDKMTVAELKQVADKGGIKYTTKTRKAELVQAIKDWLTELALEKARAQAAKIKVTLPLDNDKRIENYYHQNGCRKLTTRQVRQVRKCAFRGLNRRIKAMQS